MTTFLLKIFIQLFCLKVMRGSISGLCISAQLWSWEQQLDTCWWCSHCGSQLLIVIHITNTAWPKVCLQWDGANKLNTTNRLNCCQISLESNSDSYAMRRCSYPVNHLLKLNFNKILHMYMKIAGQLRGCEVRSYLRESPRWRDEHQYRKPTGEEGKYSRNQSECTGPLLPGQPG